MLEYGIAYGNTLPVLIVNVGHMVAEGWRPKGGVACVPTDFEGDFAGCFIQAMVKGEGSAGVGQFAFRLPAEYKAGVQ